MRLFGWSAKRTEWREWALAIVDLKFVGLLMKTRVLAVSDITVHYASDNNLVVEIVSLKINYF